MNHDELDTIIADHIDTREALNEALQLDLAADFKQTIDYRRRTELDRLHAATSIRERLDKEHTEKGQTILEQDIERVRKLHAHTKFQNTEMFDFIEHETGIRFHDVKPDPRPTRDTRVEKNPSPSRENRYPTGTRQWRVAYENGTSVNVTAETRNEAIAKSKGPILRLYDLGAYTGQTNHAQDRLLQIIRKRGH